MTKLLSIITLTAIAVLVGGCAVTKAPLRGVETPTRPNRVNLVEAVPDTTMPVSTPQLDVAEAVVAPPSCPDDFPYDPETDLCGPIVPTPTTTFVPSQNCLVDDLGVYNPETDLCELP